MPKHIGIVACSAEGAALCYTTICVEGAELLGRHDHPEVSMHTFALARYMEHIERGDWQAVAGLMLHSAEKLARVGAEFLICPDNTIHQAFALVQARSPLPWLHIADEVAEEARRRGYRKLGVLGTRYLMEGPVYPERLEKCGLGWVVPGQEQRQRINQIIFDELVYGKFLPQSRACLYHVMDDLQTQGCEAVVLGCTELPLLVIPEEAPLPVLDSTRLLARAALRHAVEAGSAAFTARNELKAPAGMFRVVGIDTYEPPGCDYLIGDFEEREEALRTAERSAGPMTPVYVYDEHGERIAAFEGGR